MTETTTNRVARIGSAASFVALLTVASCAGSGKSTVQQTVAGTQQVCSSCHGTDGRGVSPTFPSLAGQQQEYLVNQLKAFRDKTRADPHAHTYMWGMAAKLTDEMIDGLAASYAAMPPAPGAAGDNPSETAAGSVLFREGTPSGDVPACAGCHGDKAEGAGPIPRLAGQHRDYLNRQLTAFAANARANDTMHGISQPLKPEQISELTAFLTAQ